MDKAEVKVIKRLSSPTSIKAVWSFLDHTGFYRRFIKDFPKIARPLTQILDKDAPFMFHYNKAGH